MKKIKESELAVAADKFVGFTVRGCTLVPRGMMWINKEFYEELLTSGNEWGDQNEDKSLGDEFILPPKDKKKKKSNKKKTRKRKPKR